MQVVRRKGAAVFLQFMAQRPPRHLLGIHATLPRQAVALFKVAPATGGDDVFPYGAAALGTRNDMVECEVRRGAMMAAILAAEAVAQKNIEARESGVTRGGDIFLERDNARQFHFETGRMHHTVIFGKNVDAVQKHGLDGVLPGPQRQWEIT